MSQQLKDHLPKSADALLALEPEELAECLLRWFASLPPGHDRDSQLNRYNLALDHNVAQYDTRRSDASRAIKEAWAWMEAEGLVAPMPGASPGSEWYFLTRRGERAAKAGSLMDFRAERLLPTELLHPLIAQRTRASFLRGDYDTAIFTAFREVEIAVRNTGRYPDEKIGVPLMRDAFNPTSGPLTDPNAPTAEREAMSALFSGAIGVFKNPTSHRHVGVSAAGHAAQLLMFASRLLSIVDERATAKSP